MYQKQYIDHSRYNLSAAFVSPKENNGDDRVHIGVLEDGAILAVIADGSTCGGFGYVAAELFIKTCTREITKFDSSGEAIICAIHHADKEISELTFRCETTGIICVISNQLWLSVAIGDSSIYIQSPEHIVPLSQHQIRKPRIGAGASTPKISSGLMNGTIVMCTDGCNMKINQIFSLIRISRKLFPNSNPAAFVTEAAQNKGLFDDFGLIVIEKK